jgi:hypothetical protein
MTSINVIVIIIGSFQKTSIPLPQRNLKGHPSTPSEVVIHLLLQKQIVLPTPLNRRNYLRGGSAHGSFLEWPIVTIITTTTVITSTSPQLLPCIITTIITIITTLRSSTPSLLLITGHHIVTGLTATIITTVTVDVTICFNLTYS